LAIIYCFGWIIFFGSFIGNILFKDYEMVTEYKMYTFPFYSFIFIIFLTFILTLINVFKESSKTFLFLNISIVLVVLFQLFNLVIIRHTFIKNLIPFIWENFIIVGIGFLLNYYKHIPEKNELEEIGKPE